MRRSSVERVEMAAIAPLVLREGMWDAVLEAALRIDGHVDPQHRADATANDFALQSVEALGRSLRERREGYRFGDRDHRGAGVGAEPAEAVRSGAGIAADASPAQSAGVGQRVFDRFDAPALLIQHAVVADAPVRQLPFRFDRVGL